MRLVRLAAYCAASVLAACDGTGRMVTGISHGGATADRVLVFTVQPSNTTPGNNMSPVQVAALDTLGHTDTSFVSRVTVTLGTNPSDAFLRGATAANAASGVVVFGALNVDRVGSGFTLVASAPGATSVTSASFDVTAP